MSERGTWFCCFSEREQCEELQSESAAFFIADVADENAIKRAAEHSRIRRFLNS